MSVLESLPSTTKVFSYNNYPETNYEFDLSLIPDSAKHVALNVRDCPYHGTFSEQLTYLSLDLYRYPVSFVECYKQFNIGQLPNLLTFVVLVLPLIEHDLRDIVFSPKLYHFELRFGTGNNALYFCPTPSKVPSKCVRIYEIPETISEFIIMCPTSECSDAVKVIASGQLSVEDLKNRVITLPELSYGFEFL
ncbi:unnamed protein product [Ambrosiozyma monospora]|uniref:Unnamed protein product n=1 Tax=Ambrosiozyma monospora TaxID=43982 RepID=A0ACB5TXF1_AMBMO|nr:unnamed protein product [Ambrosiozyma monospora]